jgi:hypothetical protein
MAEIVRLSDHARASSGRRACKLASFSKVTPDIPRSAAALTSGAHKSEGIRLRQYHLRTAHSVEPTSAAMVSNLGSGQSSRRSRGVVLMPDVIGPIVLTVKANMSSDVLGTFSNPQPMSKDPSATDFKAAFTARIRAAREARGYTQADMARLLDPDMTQDKYKQYEGRSLLPHQYIERFCLATGVDERWLFSGVQARSSSKIRRSA